MYIQITKSCHFISCTFLLLLILKLLRWCNTYNINLNLKTHHSTAKYLLHNHTYSAHSDLPKNIIREVFFGGEKGQLECGGLKVLSIMKNLASNFVGKKH